MKALEWSGMIAGRLVLIIVVLTGWVQLMWSVDLPDLTPDPGTGHIAVWSEDEFVGRFEAGRMVAGSTMPWEAFQRPTEDDVRSLYGYLHTLEAVERNTGPVYRQKGSFKN